MLALTFGDLGRLVDIFFKSSKLAKVFNAEALLKKAYGAKNAKQIRLRMAVLDSSNTLADVPVTPPERRHQLMGEHRGCFAVDVEQPFRILFEPAHDPLPRKPDGGLDLTKITAITILDVLDYH